MGMNKYSLLLDRFTNIFNYELFNERFDFYQSDIDKESGVYYIEFDELYNDKIDLLLYNPKNEEFVRFDVDINVIESTSREDYIDIILKTIINFIKLDILENKCNLEYVDSKYGDF